MDIYLFYNQLGKSNKTICLSKVSGKFQTAAVSWGPSGTGIFLTAVKKCGWSQSPCAPEKALTAWDRTAVNGRHQVQGECGAGHAGSRGSGSPGSRPCSSCSLSPHVPTSLEASQVVRSRQMKEEGPSRLTFVPSLEPASPGPNSRAGGWGDAGWWRWWL